MTIPVSCDCDRDLHRRNGEDQTPEDEIGETEAVRANICLSFSFDLLCQCGPHRQDRQSVSGGESPSSRGSSDIRSFGSFFIFYGYPSSYDGSSANPACISPFRYITAEPERRMSPAMRIPYPS